MVAMGVGAHDRRDRPAADRLLERLEVLGQIGARIDHRDLMLANQVGLGPIISESRRVVGQHPCNAGLQRDQFCVRRVHLAPLPFAPLQVELVATQSELPARLGSRPVHDHL